MMEEAGSVGVEDSYIFDSLNMSCCNIKKFENAALQALENRWAVSTSHRGY